MALAGAKGELMRRIGQELGLKVVYEAFPDRAYSPEGTLVSRKLPGAVIRDAQAVSVGRGSARAASAGCGSVRPPMTGPRALRRPM